MSRAETLNKWTGAELKELRRIFATASTADLVKAFPRHSLGSTRTTANRLGLNKSRGHRRWAAIVHNHVPTFEFARIVYD